MLSMMIICSSTVSVTNCTNSYDTYDETFFYGFVISYVKLDNLTIENQINEDISHMINDLLRENISVFWTAVDKNITIEKLYDNEQKNMVFEKGSFIVPFTNVNTYDIKILVIINEYNQTREFSEYRAFKVPIYLISEQISISAYPLNRVKIAHYRDLISACDFIYLEVSQKLGFLDFEYLDFYELRDRLNYKDFNVIVIPGAGNIYFPKEKTILGLSAMILQDLLYGAANAVRNFVGNEGGGYVGSCYGAYKASCGVSELNIYFKRKAYNPTLRSIGIYAISDTITKQPDPVIMDRVKIKITNHSHPLVYSISEDIVIDHHYGGPIFTHIGNNSQKISEFHDNGYSADGTASWISTDFGKGKAILFSPHPEIVAIFGNQKDAEIGKRLIGNSYFYTSSEPKEIVDMSLGYNLTYIDNKLIEINNLSIPESITKYFLNETKEQINKIITDTDSLIENVSEVIDTIKLIAEDNGIDVYEKNNKLYLGFDTVNDTNYTFNLFKTNLIKSLLAIKQFEKLFSLDENNEFLCNQIKNLKTSISVYFNSSTNIIDEVFKILETYDTNLEKFKNVKTKIVENLLENKITKIMIDLYDNTRGLLDNIPQIYFNSIKSIRTSWYNFEVDSLL